MDLGTFEVTASGVIMKWFAVAGLAMYTFFTIVVVKQVGIMTESVESEINNLVKAFARLHFLLALFLTIAALVIL